MFRQPYDRRSLDIREVVVGVVVIVDVIVEITASTSEVGTGVADCFDPTDVTADTVSGYSLPSSLSLDALLRPALRPRLRPSPRVLTL